ncbi:MAG: sigma-70 family RNA polymerase sigma factor [Cyanobacteria bacterium K_DeepCast_35m_m1_288]|jgi:DNA-directed RNA polymerase specialized sigma subunit|nr:sigma-70 family RNA polymerase sigma factor [Cyanobacteria bacterium K_DeepCast_35m_m1_288]
MRSHLPRPSGHRASAGPGVRALRSKQPRAGRCPLAAADALVLEHLEFAYRVAGHYAARTPIPRDDLQQEAAIGLLKAARRYDPGHGSPRPGHFRAYARPFINGEIRHYLRDKGFPISIPGRWRELHARGRKLLQSGCPAEQVPLRLGISLERWSEIVRACAVRVVALPVEGWEPER